MKKKEISKAFSCPMGGEHDYNYEVSTPRGDFYRCSKCDKRIHEKELPRYGERGNN